MSRLGVFRIELGFCLPILFPSAMSRLSDFSSSLQLAWKRSFYFTCWLIYSRFPLNFLHKLPSIIVGSYFYLLTHDSIWLIEDFHNVKSLLKTWVWADGWFGLLDSLVWITFNIWILIPNDAFHLLRLDLLCHSPSTFCWWGLGHPTSPQDLNLSRWFVNPFIFNFVKYL